MKRLLVALFALTLLAPLAARADTVAKVDYFHLTQTPERDGSLLWCTNCNQVAPCTGPLSLSDSTQGPGAFAFGYSGAWQCAAPTVSLFNPAVPGPIGGTTPGAGTFTTLNATSAPALGAIGGTTPSTIVGTTITASSTGDEALKTANGGHLSSLLGTGTLPTVGTGTVTAGGTDNAMEVTGGTSPVTVTFNTVFHAKPICTCGDETAAVGACEVVANSNGATAVVTTTATDSFTLLCVGK